MPTQSKFTKCTKNFFVNVDATKQMMNVLFSIGIGFQLQLNFRKRTFNTFPALSFLVYINLIYGYHVGLFFEM